MAGGSIGPYGVLYHTTIRFYSTLRTGPSIYRSSRIGACRISGMLRGPGSARRLRGREGGSGTGPHV